MTQWEAVVNLMELLRIKEAHCKLRDRFEAAFEQSPLGSLVAGACLAEYDVHLERLQAVIDTAKSAYVDLIATLE
jgi:hypothetical protein